MTRRSAPTRSCLPTARSAMPAPPTSTPANCTAALKVASQKSLPRYEVLQPEYNLYDRSSLDGPLLDLCVKEEIGVITYFSLAKGFLSGKYRSEADLGKSPRGGGVGKYLDARGLRILAALDAVSARHSATQAEVALAWVIARPGDHRADRQRHHAGAGRQPDPRRLAEAQRCGYRRARRGKRGVTSGVRSRRRVPCSRLTAVGGSGGGFSDFAASTSKLVAGGFRFAISRCMNSSRSRPGSDRLQEARLDRAGIAHEFAPRPVEAGDMRDRHDRHAELRVELDDAVFVGRLVARRAPRAFGIDDQLAVVRHLRLGCRHHRLQRFGAACRDRPGSSASWRCTSRRTVSTSVRASGCRAGRADRGRRRSHPRRTGVSGRG